MGSRKNAAGVPNFGEVTPSLYRGAQPGINGFKTLQAMGINIVVDMRTGERDEQLTVEQLGMRYISIPWYSPFPSDEIFVRFLKVIEDNPGKKIFVHCHRGVDRTGMAIAAYRMAEEGWSADEAMAEMRLFGFSGLHHLMLPTLARFEKQFPRKLKSDSAYEELQAGKK